MIGLYEAKLNSALNEKIKEIQVEGKNQIFSILHNYYGAIVSVSRYPMGQIMHIITCSFAIRFNLALVDISFPVEYPKSKLTGEIGQDVEIIIYNIEYFLGKFLKVFQEVDN